jgi:hypothetical protein
MRITKRSKLVIVFMFVMGTILLLAACETKRYRYQITGTVDTKSGKHAAVWYTDTILYSHDTAVIVNSNGTVWKIAPEYTVTELKK